jgi:hypothetical protein
MAKKASEKSTRGTGKKLAKSSNSGEGGSRSNSNSSNHSDPVDALIKLLQSPLVIDLLAVGATAALAAITESRSNRTQGAVGTNKKTLKEAGKAAAAAVGRRLANEFDEIRSASKKAGEDRKATAGAEA